MLDSSWSSGRNEKKVTVPVEKIYENVSYLNELLRKLTNDNDFQDDIKLPIVNAAMQHWMNIKRLPPEQAAEFQRDIRVQQIFEKVKMIQHACKSISIEVPSSLLLDLALKKRNFIPKEMLSKLVGESAAEFIKNNHVDYLEVQQNIENPYFTKKEWEKKELINAEQDIAKEEGKGRRSSLSTPKPNAGDGITMKSSKLLQWGHEDIGTENFRWWKLILRSLIDCLILGGFCYLLATYASSGFKLDEQQEL